MSQRASGYERRADEAYDSPPWVAATIANILRLANVTSIWEPAVGAGQLANAFRLEGFDTASTGGDFLALQEPPRKVDAVITNPPYGRGGELARAFIQHALTMPVRHVIMLLRVDFDSAKTRVDLFRDNAAFTGKVVLLDRIKWFPGAFGPSDNHAWYFWDRHHRRYLPPWIRYAQNLEKVKR